MTILKGGKGADINSGEVMTMVIMMMVVAIAEHSDDRHLLATMCQPFGQVL